MSGSITLLSKVALEQAEQFANEGVDYAEAIGRIPHSRGLRRPVLESFAVAAS